MKFPKKKVAIVTGGGSGIGRSTALAFARAGVKVVVADTDEEQGNNTVSLITDEEGESLFVTADVSQTDDVQSMVETTVSTWGQLDFAFNNAGIQGEISETVECSERNWDSITNVNLKGVWLCMKYEIAAMKKGTGGVIVNNASNFGLVGSPGMPAYSASKHGVIGLTKTAAIENAKNGIRINAVCPGPISTPLVDKIVSRQPEVLDSITEREPIGRMGRPNEISGAVLWLCSDDASFVIGAALSIDGGFVAQ